MPIPSSPDMEVRDVRFLRDSGGLAAVEYIVIGAISLIVIGAAIWQLAGSVAGRLTDLNGAL